MSNDNNHNDCIKTLYTSLPRQVWKRPTTKLRPKVPESDLISSLNHQTPSPLPTYYSGPLLLPKHPPPPIPLHNPTIPRAPPLVNLHPTRIPAILRSLPRTLHATTSIPVRRSTRTTLNNIIITRALFSVLKTNPLVPLTHT
jgi:hypothetical protein